MFDMHVLREKCLCWMGLKKEARQPRRRAFVQMLSSLERFPVRPVSMSSFGSVWPVSWFVFGRSLTSRVLPWRVLSVRSSASVSPWGGVLVLSG